MAVSNSVNCQIDGTGKGFPQVPRQSRLGLNSWMNSSLFPVLSHLPCGRISLKKVC